jgi:hypothetical protein
MEKLDEETEKGIEAIIYLQGMAGIEEPREKALAGWRGMSASERVTTMNAYQIFADGGK